MAVRAAAEDAAAADRLALTLRNAAGATNELVASTETWIDKTQRATGVADTQLRPALAVLTTGTKDVAKAQELLTLAMDIAQGTGTDLATVSDALAKAYAGNMRGLQALSPEMKAMIRDGATADEVFATLAATFKDQTAVHAETMEGKLARVNVAFGEMQEKLGAKLLPLVVDLGNWLIETGIPKMEEIATKVDAWWTKQDGLRDAIEKGAEMLMSLIDNVVMFVGWIDTAIEKIDAFAKKLNSIPNKIFGVSTGFGATGGETRSEFEEKFGKRASGGPVSAGGTYVVGEDGSELLQMGGRSGNIIPNGGVVGGVVGGATYNVYLTVEGSVTTERELVAHLGDALRRQMAGSR